MKKLIVTILILFLLIDIAAISYYLYLKYNDVSFKESSIYKFVSQSGATVLFEKAWDYLKEKYDNINDVDVTPEKTPPYTGPIDIYCWKHMVSGDSVVINDNLNYQCKQQTCAVCVYSKSQRMVNTHYCQSVGICPDSIQISLAIKQLGA